MARAWLCKIIGHSNLERRWCAYSKSEPYMKKGEGEWPMTEIGVKWVPAGGAYHHYCMRCGVCQQREEYRDAPDIV